MLLVISPAKTLDYETELPSQVSTQPQFVDQSQLLIDQLKEFSPSDVSKLMGVSDKLASLNVARYLSWQPNFDFDNSRQAILAFKGDVYAGLDAYSLSREDLEYAQQHLRILSGLYGLLRPLDLMQPYRLEMGTKLQNPRGKDLYSFWGDRITEALNTQMQAVGTDTLLNLASNEYFGAVNKKALDGQIVSPVFKDFKTDKYKIISFYAKKARGTMSRWIIQNKVTEVSQVADFNLDGYYYSEADSKPEAPVFLRDGS